LLAGRRLAVLESAQLLLGADGQPELDEDSAEIDLLTLEIVDLRIGALPFLRRGEALDALHQHPAVPGAVEDDHPSRGGQAAPEAPEVRMGLLLVGWSGDGHHAVIAGVHGAREPADGASLAGGVGALEDQDGRSAEFSQSAREPSQLTLEVPQLFLV